MASPGDGMTGILGRRDSLRQAILLPLGIGVLTWCWTALPVLFDRGHRLEDLAQGVGMAAALAITFIMMSLLLAIRSARQRALSGRSSLVILLGLLGLWFMVGLSAILLLCGREQRLAADLVTHGVPVQAKFDRMYIESCGRHGCSFGMEYSFVPRKRSDVVKGHVNEGYAQAGSDPALNYAKSTGTIPVLYDPADPSRSMVYWSDRVQREASGSVAASEIRFFTLLLAGALILFGALLWPSMRATSLRARAAATSS